MSDSPVGDLLDGLREKIEEAIDRRIVMGLRYLADDAIISVRESDEKNSTLVQIFLSTEPEIVVRIGLEEMLLDGLRDMREDEFWESIADMRAILVRVIEQIDRAKGS